MNIMDYIAPELLLVVPVLWVFGKLLKEAAFVRDKYIPLILGGVGIVLSVCYVAGSGAAVTAAGIFTAVTQGILCAGVAVYGHQLVKQAGKKDDGEEDDNAIRAIGFHWEADDETEDDDGEEDGDE